MSDKNVKAIIQVGAKQYLVKAGDKITSEKIDLSGKKELLVNEVLLINDGSKTLVGAPVLENASVTLEHLEDNKADKIRVAKFKAKSRYRKVLGHRQQQSIFEVKAINYK